jgi:preprotein translocase subunit SecG
MASERIFQIHCRESLTAENKMQRVLYIASLAGLFLIITLCVSCSNNQSSSSYVSERVEDLKKLTAPSDASVAETAGIASKGQSVSAGWEFDTSQTRGDYLGWVTHRLQPSYELESSGESRLVFGKHLGGDYEAVTIQTTTTKESLHVKVAYVIFPD